jgi:hypothetical protein
MRHRNGRKEQTGYSEVRFHGSLEFMMKETLPPNVLRLSCKARLVMLVLSYPMGRALPAPNAG